MTTKTCPEKIKQWKKDICEAFDKADNLKGEKRAIIFAIDYGIVRFKA